MNPSLLTWLCRATQAGTVPRLKNEPATLVAQKDTFPVIALDLRRLMKVLPKKGTSIPVVAEDIIVGRCRCSITTVS